MTPAISLLVGRDVHDLAQSEQQIKTAIFLGIGAIVVLGLLGGLILSRWMLTRLERINRSTARIMAGEFGRRIATHGNGDEFDDLAQNLNAMLDRIERLLAGMRQVSEDIAHDLRTPLNRMRSRIEVALMGAPDTEEARGLLEDTLRDADGLIETFNALLAIARAEAGAQHGDWDRLDLAELARDVAELYEPLAEEASITLRLDARDGAMILGHRQLVAQAIANIADNAIKYTPAGWDGVHHHGGATGAVGDGDRHRPRDPGRAARARQAALRAPGRAALDARQRPGPEPGRRGGQAARRQADAGGQRPGPAGHPDVQAGACIARRAGARQGRLSAGPAPRYGR